jgi:peptidoglycan hydrolase CwlO-like protein
MPPSCPHRDGRAPTGLGTRRGRRETGSRGEISRADASAARVLAGGADRDVSDVKTLLRAHTQTLNALRETQVEQGQKLSRLDAKVDQMDAKVDHLDAKVDRALGLLSTGTAQIVAMLENQRREDTGSDWAR